MRLQKMKIHNPGGFTILEVLIAMAIFAIGILGVAKMQLSAVSGNSSARGMTEAAAVGQQQIEQLMALPYDDPLLSDTNGNGTGQDADNDGVDDSGNNFGLDDFGAAADHTAVVDIVYNIFWNVAVDQPIQSAKKIRVIVRWQSSGFAVKQLVFDTVRVSM
jgi:type IV pilus assembly protein PilV